jgi:type II secretory pathway pseudopilin PulG
MRVGLRKKVESCGDVELGRKSSIRSCICNAVEVGVRKMSILSRKSPVSGTRGFTLLELLLVVSLMMVLLGLLIPAFFKVRNEARKKQAQTEARIIGHAISAYKLQERRLPAPESHLSGGQDRAYGDTSDTGATAGGNAQVLNLLLEVKPPVLDVNRVRLDAGGNAVNPWGRQYRISLDLNYNGEVAGKAAYYDVFWDLR